MNNTNLIARLRNEAKMWRDNIEALAATGCDEIELETACHEQLIVVLKAAADALEAAQPGEDVVERDPHRGGDNYEASMLRNLLARIHRDGGHYVKKHGLDKALEDADAQVVRWLALKC